jgi:DNA-binding IclR family transcriptional regulator
METTDRKGGHVQSVDRALAVLEFLAQRGWARVTEVANELKIHKSTAYRLLTTLRDRGMVEQSAVTEKYRLGFGLVLLASAVTADLDIVRCARPICERLSEQTGETVTVAVLEGDDAVIIHQTISRSSALSADWTGMHTPLHATAAGKLFLVHMPEDQRRRILKKPLERFTKNTVVDLKVLNDRLQEVTREDYAFTAEELEVGLSAVASPIRDVNGSVVAAVSVSGPSFRLPVESVQEIVGPVREAAVEISQCLGFRRWEEGATP